jgi:hypothetical protein
MWSNLVVGGTKLLSKVVVADSTDIDDVFWREDVLQYDGIDQRIISPSIPR